MPCRLESDEDGKMPGYSALCQTSAPGEVMTKPSPESPPSLLTTCLQRVASACRKRRAAPLCLGTLRAEERFRDTKIAAPLCAFRAFSRQFSSPQVSCMQRSWEQVPESHFYARHQIGPWGPDDQLRMIGHHPVSRKNRLVPGPDSRTTYCASYSRSDFEP